jgi:hypothetical protein
LFPEHWFAVQEVQHLPTVLGVHVEHVVEVAAVNEALMHF